MHHTHLPVGNSMVPASSRATTLHLSRVRPSLPASDASLLLLPCSTPKYTHQTWHKAPPLKTAYPMCVFLVCLSVNLVSLSDESVLFFLRWRCSCVVHLWNSPSGTCSFLPAPFQILRATIIKNSCADTSILFFPHTVGTSQRVTPPLDKDNGFVLRCMPSDLVPALTHAFWS